jgi:myo-inositol-1-phosphate synthase
MSNGIRIGIVGVGNCAAALAAGLEWYNGRPETEQSGLMFPQIGPYTVRDICPVIGFDVDARKVNRSLGEALNSEPICVSSRPSSAAWGDVPVLMGSPLDGTTSKYSKTSPKGIAQSQCSPVDIPKALVDLGVHVVLNYLPVGSVKATEFYAAQCIEAGVAFCNCMPTFIVSDPKWALRFAKARIPVIGDDVKSQFGATAVHRSLIHLARLRGVRVTRTYQLNVGGNGDFLNMLDRERLAEKVASKRGSLLSAMEPTDDHDVHVSPTDFVDWLDDNKVCFIRVEGVGYGGSSVHLDLRLSVQDSPNSAGSVIDAIRFLKLASDEGSGGPLQIPSAFLMKAPPVALEEPIGHRGCYQIARGQLRACASPEDIQ